MKKKIEIHTEKAEPFAVFNYCRDILKKYGNGIDAEKLEIFDKTQKKSKTIEFYGNKNCGIKNEFSREIEMGVAYIIKSEYTVYGLEEKNKLTIKRVFHTSVWEENEMEITFIINGKPEFVDFNEQNIKQHFKEAVYK